MQCKQRVQPGPHLVFHAGAQAPVAAQLPRNGTVAHFREESAQQVCRHIRRTKPRQDQHRVPVTPGRKPLHAPAQCRAGGELQQGTRFECQQQSGWRRGVWSRGRRRSGGRDHGLSSFRKRGQE